MPKIRYDVFAVPCLSNGYFVVVYQNATMMELAEAIEQSGANDAIVSDGPVYTWIGKQLPKEQKKAQNAKNVGLN